MPPHSIAVLISGRGSNMRALVEQSTAAVPAPYRVSVVLSDKPAAQGLAVARDLGIETRAMLPDASAHRSDYDARLAAALDEFEPSLIVLAGFMRILSGSFVERYAGRILNIHPSLLPKYPGLHTHARALAAHDVVHGATVHFVSEKLDGGPRVIQAEVPIEPEDDESSLAARVQTQEHRIYPLAVRWFCEGRLTCSEDRAWLDGEALAIPVRYAASSARSPR